MMKKRLSKTLWYGSDIDKEGKPVLPPLAEEANDLEGIHEGELYLHIGDGLALLFTRSADGQVVQLGSNADELANYLLKSVWDKAFEFRTTENGEEYLFTKLNLATQYGITMYANGGLLDLPNIFEGLPIDNDTIYWDGDVLKSRGVGEGGVTPTLLGDLKNVGSWANGIATEDRIMVQKKDSSSWEALELSKIGGSASFENVKESGEGNAFTSFVLSDDKKTLTFAKDKTFAEKSNTLLGYGITDAYTKTEADNLLAKKWTQDNNKITNWDAAFGWGDHSKAGYFLASNFTKEKVKSTLGISNWALESVKPSYTTKEVTEDTNLYFTNQRAVDALADTLTKYVTISGTQTITGSKDFTGGLKVNGSEIVYDKTSKYWKLTGDLVITGGITMYANDGSYTPSTLTDAIGIDNITIVRQDGKLMVNPELVFGGGGGGEVSSVAWGNVLGKPSWITDTKPEYKYSEIKETPNLDEYAKKGTTLSAYGITDANINNGVITLGNNTITPLTQVLGDARYVTALGTSGNDLTWTKDGTTNKITIPYATHSAHTSYLRNYMGDYNSITDLNEPSTFKTSQYRVVYDFYDGNTANRPVTSNNASGVLTLFKGIHRTGGGQYMSQMAFPDKDAVYFRRATDGVFGEWKQIAFTDSDITGNAGTATALKNAVNLWGNPFDGTKDVSGDMTGVGSVTMNGQLSLNGITIKRSADGVLFVDGNLVVSGGVTMYGTDGTTAPLIWDDAPIANTNGKKGVASYDPNFFAVNNGVVTFVGQTGGGGTDIDLSEYAKKATTLAGYGITDAYTKAEVDSNFVVKTTKDFMKVNGSLTSNVDFNDYYTSGSYNNTTGNGSGNSNAPGTYGLMLVFGDKSGYAAQLHVNSGNTSVKVRTRYMSGGAFSWKEWKELAYTTSNVASATKLETARNIWGQSFNGTEDVSGALSGVTSISMNGSINNAITVISEEDGSTIKGAGHRMYFGGTGYANQSYYFRPLYGYSGATTTALYLQNASASSSPTFTTTHALRSDGSASHTGNLSVGGSVTINGGILTYNSTNKYWKLEGDLLVTGGVTMFGNDSSFSPSTITQAVNVDGTTIINDGKKLMLNPDIQLGGGGVTDYNDLTNKPNLSVYALKTSLSNYQTKITTTNKLDYGLISGTPTKVSAFTNDAKYITKNIIAESGAGLSINYSERLPYIEFQKDGVNGGFIGGATAGHMFIQVGTASDDEYSLLKVNRNGSLAVNYKGTDYAVATEKNASSFTVGNATTASKLSTVSKTAWGKTYWTSGGVPTTIDGDMSNVGNITSKANGTYEIGSSSNKWKDLWVGNVKYTDTMYLGFSSSYASIRVGGSGSQLVVDDTSVRTNSSDSARASLGKGDVPWNGLYLGINSSAANNKYGVNFSDANGNTVARLASSGSLFGIYAKGELRLRGGCTAGLDAMTASSTGAIIDTSGNMLVTGGVTMYSDLRKKTILNHVELSLKEVADAPLIEHYYNSDESKRTHVGSVAQYWAGLNDWFCKEDGEGFLTMEIQNAALASAISVARELTRYESKTDKQIKKLKKRIGELEEEIENLKKM